MKNYWIDALSPLVFRSGKPFGTETDQLNIVFPFPSSAAGLVRTQVMQQHGISEPDALRQIAVNGLFLARCRNGDFRQPEILVRKPSDALYIKNKQNAVQLVRLAPAETEAGCGSDLPEGLMPVYMTEHFDGKPQSGAEFWRWEDFCAWQRGEALDFDTVNQNGAAALPTETRTHVAIDGSSLAAEEGKLFQTTAYDFASRAKSHHQGWENENYGFLIRTDADLKTGLIRFGGEGRLSRLHPLDNHTLFSTAALPASAQSFSLTLLTPAVFAQGWLPEWLDADTLTGTLPDTNITVKLCAAALSRWQPVSGWDFEHNRPKAMRKAVPAGSVYWFECIGGASVDLQKLAFQSLCGQQQDRKDGFGIVSPALWKK